MNRRSVGSAYEAKAASYLEESGYHIIARNYHDGRYGEIDIIAESPDKVLVAVEVKYRSTDAMGDPAEAVTLAKQKKISNAFVGFLKRNGYSFDGDFRFDVIAVSKDGEVRHIQDAFFYAGMR